MIKIVDTNILELDHEVPHFVKELSDANGKYTEQDTTKI